MAVIEGSGGDKRLVLFVVLPGCGGPPCLHAGPPCTLHGEGEMTHTFYIRDTMLG